MFFVAAPLRELQLGLCPRTRARSADAIRTKELTAGLRQADAAVHRATHAYRRSTLACGATEKRRARHFAVSGCTIRRDSLLQLPYYCTFATEAQLLQREFTRQAVNQIILSPLKPSIMNQPFREIVRGLCCCLPAACLFCGCIDSTVDYSDLDKQIAINVDGLKVRLGNTEKNETGRSAQAGWPCQVRWQGHLLPR